MCLNICIFIAAVLCEFRLYLGFTRGISVWPLISCNYVVNLKLGTKYQN